MRDHSISLFRRKSSLRYLEVEPYPACTRPTLDQVIRNVAPPPFTLANLAKFLHRNFCSEVLAFILDVAVYQQHYSLIQSHSGSEELLAEKKAEAWGVWHRIIKTYIISESKNEINIPGHERERILGQQFGQELPNPTGLDVAYQMMYELLEGVYVQFMQGIERDIGCIW
jgi:hypothetical protein